MYSNRWLHEWLLLSSASSCGRVASYVTSCLKLPASWKPSTCVLDTAECCTDVMMRPSAGNTRGAVSIHTRTTPTRGHRV